MGFTEGVLIDAESKRWKERSMYDEIEQVCRDDQLIEIEGQPRDREFSKAKEPNDIFPHSILIVREDVLDRIYVSMKKIMGGHDFPTRASLIVLKDREDPTLIKQMKRDIGVSPAKVSTPLELRCLIKSHLNAMDPVNSEGVRNIKQFETEVCEVTNNKYSFDVEE